MAEAVNHKHHFGGVGLAVTAWDSNAPTHNRADVLVVCQRFETGYDNDAVCVLGVDRQMSSEEPPRQKRS